MLIIDENIIALDDLADDLSHQFLDLAVVKAYTAKKIAFDSDDALQGKLRVLTENQAYIAHRPEIRSLQQELMMTDEIYQLKLAENDVQGALSELVIKIAGVISADISVDEHLPLKKGGHHGKKHTCGG